MKNLQRAISRLWQCGNEDAFLKLTQDIECCVEKYSHFIDNIFAYLSQTNKNHLENMLKQYAPQLLKKMDGWKTYLEIGSVA